MINPFENGVFPILETEQYLLRVLTLEDAPALFEFMSNAETMKYATAHHFLINFILNVVT